MLNEFRILECKVMFACGNVKGSFTHPPYLLLLKRVTVLQGLFKPPQSLVRKVFY